MGTILGGEVMAEFSTDGIKALVEAEHGNPSLLIQRLRHRQRLNDDEIEFLVRAISPARRGAPEKVGSYEDSMEIVKVLTVYYWHKSYSKASEVTKKRKSTIERYRKRMDSGELHPAARAALGVNLTIINRYGRNEESKGMLADFLAFPKK